MAPEIQAVIRFATIAQQILALRVLTYMGFIASTALFGVALWLPSWERAVTASLFAVLIYWPLIRAERGKTPQGE